ncbi:MAG: hypothetical protein IJ368_09115 [Oscillospiraceae bacterium]|nr:hypothetical protein [Oscillospiraceae bacterium]
MRTEDKKKIAELERDIKKMQKEHEQIFAEFNKKKSLRQKIADRLKKIFTPKSR